MKNILIVVDMQDNFLAMPHASRLFHNVCQLLPKHIFDVVVATRFSHLIVGNIPDYADKIITKSHYSCVNDDFIQELEALNDGNYPHHVFIVGIDTDVAIFNIAADLYNRDILPVVLTKYCDSNGGPVSHQAGITCMKRMFGKDLVSDKLINNRMDLDMI